MDLWLPAAGVVARMEHGEIRGEWMVGSSRIPAFGLHPGYELRIFRATRLGSPDGAQRNPGRRGRRVVNQDMTGGH